MRLSDHVLEALPVSVATPCDSMPFLERALDGVATYLPLPDARTVAGQTRAELLCRTQRVGESIDPAIALVAATSGSTGIPKGAELTADMLRASATATHTALGGDGHWVLALPAHHIAGIQVLIRCLVAHTTPLFTSVAQGFNVQDFARVTAEGVRAASRSGKALYTSLVPHQVAKALNTKEGVAALRAYTAILVGGSRVDVRLLDEAQQKGIALHTTYGSSETCGGLIYDGIPIPGARVDVNPTSGRIFLAGPMVARSYRNIPHAECFHEREGWYATQDAGILSDGHLTITGRIDAQISSGGLKLQPEILERILETIPGVEDSCVVGVPDLSLGQMIAALYVGNADSRSVLHHLREHPSVEHWQIPKRIQHVEKLPMTALGKRDRPAALRMFLHHMQDTDSSRTQTGEGNE